MCKAAPSTIFLIWSLVRMGNFSLIKNDKIANVLGIKTKTFLMNFSTPIVYMNMLTPQI